MNSEFAVELARNALLLTILLGAPVMVVAMVVGLVISLFQAVTQIQDQTLSFAPKIVIIFLALLVTLPWTINLMVDYSVDLYTHIPQNL